MIYYTFFVLLLLGAAWCAYAISAADMRRRIIPDAYLFPLLLIGLMIFAFFGDMWVCTFSDGVIGATFGYILGATVGFVFDYFMQKRNQNAPTPIGFGDIKLLAVGGLWLGPTGLAWALMLSCLFGMVWARVRHVRFIPFAPFFVAGAILTLIGIRFLL